MTDWELVPLETDYSHPDRPDVLFRGGYGGGTALSPYTPTLSERVGNTVSDTLRALGMRAGTAADIGGNAKALAGLTPPAAAYDAGRALGAGQYGEAALNALGAIPNGGQMAHLAPAMFIGPMARGIDREALGLARDATTLSQKDVQAAKAAGLDRNAIYEGTGWFQGPDKKFRTELSDKDAKLGALGAKESGSLWDALEHPDLFRAYPELHNVKVSRLPPLEEALNPGLRGGYLPMGEAGAEFHEPTIYLNSKMSPEERKTTLLHETQHAIQDIEGFAGGGNQHIAPPNYDHEDVQAIKRKREALIKEWEKLPDDHPELKPLTDKIRQMGDDMRAAARFHGYQGISGEVEARNVQKRADYSPEQRLARAPYNTEDVPAGQQTLGEVPQPWKDRIAYVPDPLERVLNAQGSEVGPEGWAEAAKHDAARSRWLLETGALGPDYARWKDLSNDLTKAVATKNQSKIDYLNNELDKIHSRLNDSQMDMLERSLDYPREDTIKDWTQVGRHFDRTANGSTEEVQRDLKFSNNVQNLFGRSFADLNPTERNTLAKVEWAIQHHGPEVVGPHAQYRHETYVPGLRQQILSPGWYDKVLGPAQEAFMQNHERLISEARQHYADRAMRHFNMEPTDGTE